MSERHRLRRQGHSLISKTGVVLNLRLPSHRVIKLDHVVVDQIPAGTIVPSSKRFPAAFFAPKGGDDRPRKDKQSNWRSIKGSRRHRARVDGYHGGLA